MRPSTYAANRQVAETFQEVASLLDRAGDNPYRAAAYARAAETVAALPGDLRQLCAAPDAEAQLDALPGIGPDLAAKVREICKTGRLRVLVNLRAGRPMARKDMRYPLEWAEPQARALAEAIRLIPGVVDAKVAGSIRRRLATVGDADLLVIAGPDVDVAASVTARPDVSEVSAAGPHRVSVRLVGGLPVDLLIAAPESAGAALLHWTGSKTHNISLRRRARGRGLKLNEYGLFKGRRRVAGETEAGIYAALGVAMPAPTAREAAVLVEA